MIPIGDSPRTWRTPWVNYSLILTNVLVFLYELSLGPDLDSFIVRWGVVPARVTASVAGAAATDHLAILTLVTATFLHGGWLHLGGNLLFLWIFGDNVEDRLGHGVYLLFYLAGGIIANLGQIAADPTSSVPAIGASGAIAGVLGAYAITFPGARVSVIFPILFFLWPIDIPALIMIGFWFVTQFFSGVAVISAVGAQAGGVAWWAHVAGFASGILLMIVLPKQPAPGPIGNIRGRASYEDTGLLGLLVGTVSLVSQLVQLALAVRVVALYLDVRQVGQATALLIEDLRLTTPLVTPFASLLRPVRFLGHPLEVAGIVAIVVVYTIGVALVRAIDSILSRPNWRD